MAINGCMVGIKKQIVWTFRDGNWSGGQTGAQSKPTPINGRFDSDSFL